MRKPLTSLQQPNQFLDRRDNILFNAVEAYHVTDGHVAILIEFIVLAFVRALPKRAVILALIFLFVRFGADISDGEDALRFIVEVGDAFLVGNYNSVGDRSQNFALDLL